MSPGLDASPHRPPPRVGVLLERSLGHVTHAETLTRLLPDEPGIRAEIRHVEFAVEGWPARVPGFGSNWTLRAGVRGRRLVRSMRAGGPLDALFVNTQVPSVLMPDVMRRVPTVVSLDATPLQFDELGEPYDHHVGARPVERLKWHANRASFRRAARIVTWSAWAKEGVVSGYGIDADKITVIPPGVTPSLWRRTAARSDGPIRILFVGGDLKRKGGDQLIDVVRGLRAERDVTLDVVTTADIPEQTGVTVHHGLRPNSAELVALFHQADILALPTRADCLPLVLLEGAAAGLPLVSTDIAGIPEIVVDGETGLVVPVGDRDALGRALTRLLDDPDLRRRLGDGAAASVAERFDAARNTHRLVELLAAVADRGDAHDAPGRRR